MRKIFLALSWLLLLCGGLFLWRGGSDYWQSVSGQKEEALAWENQNAEAESVDVSPVSGAVSLRHTNLERGGKGQSIAKLSIPRLDTTLYVLEGTDDRDLKRGPGHLEGTVMPGASGNCVIAGHRDTHFRVLKGIAKGDEILVESREGKYRYRVTGTSVVTPDNTDSLKPTTAAVLNLITCFPFDYVGAAPRRFIVHADLVKL